jgi:hypothetical protein
MNPARFDFVLPREIDQDLQDLESSTGLSCGEIFQRALSLYKLAIETRSTGLTLRVLTLLRKGSNE